ncbi:conserved phage C-terminal domain-containing protein [Clostridium sp.]|uniref:conserved phage C-terminal domain-containing protein n=1 Tax=Clostridium sp. TaxID=1506 RepID=UPI003217E3D7
MKHTIMGFRQEKLVKLGLDIIDASILRYFIDFKDSNGMNTRKVDGKLYYWLRYDAVLKEFPIFRMKKCTVQSRFFKLRDAGVLTHLVVREKGTYSYFGIGENYEELITRDTDTEYKDIENKGIEHKNIKNKCIENKDMDYKDSYEKNKFTLEPEENYGDNGFIKDMDENSKGISEDSKGYGLISTTNNPSTKDSSNKINKSVSLQKTAFEIIEYLNLETGKNFRSTTKITIRLIKARLNEGFTLEDFKTVIDNMKYRWTGTKFQQYLVPTTLFGNKFETYLNQDRKVEKEVDGKFKRGNMVLSDEKNKAQLKEKLKKMVLKEDM